MKRVLCINKVYTHCRITIGQYYNVLEEYWTNDIKTGERVIAYVLYKDDTGVKGNYTSGQFKSISQIRNEKLESIGI